VELTVMSTTQRNSELIAYLAPKGAMLCESQVMCIGGLPAANQACLLGNRSDMIPITNSPLLRKSQLALINLL
jgi:transcriptional regulator of met regulon